MLYVSPVLGVIPVLAVLLEFLRGFAGLLTLSENRTAKGASLKGGRQRRRVPSAKRCERFSYSVPPELTGEPATSVRRENGALEAGRPILNTQLLLNTTVVTAAEFVLPISPILIEFSL